MAILGATFFDLIDKYKTEDRAGNSLTVIEQLSQMNPMIRDAIMVECNSGSKHLHSVRTGYPSVSWGKLYKGIKQSKSTYAQVEDTTGFVEGLSTVDVRLLKRSKEPAKVRAVEGMGFLEAMDQEVQSRIIYGNTNSAAEEIHGLAPRFNDLSAPSGNQIIDAGGTGSDNTSIWMVTWGDSQCQLIYPEGTMAGLDREDKGEQRVLDSSGDPYYVKEELYTWHTGLAVKDWRYVSRIANIDVNDMAAGSVALYDFMRKAFYKLQNRRVPGGNLAIYCNREVLEALDALATNAGTTDNFVRLTRKEVEGEEVLSYRSIPIRGTDAILNTEARVV